MNDMIDFILMHPFFKNELSEKYANAMNVDPPLYVNFQKADSSLYVITGPNASGKSFFVKQIKAYASQKNIKQYHMGLLSRTASLYEAHSEHFWSLVPEDIASTGENSSVLLLNGIEGFSKQNEETIILLDEPALGLSTEYKQVVANYLVEFSQRTSKKLKGLFVCSHDHQILSALEEITHNHILLEMIKH